MVYHGVATLPFTLIDVYFTDNSSVTRFT